MNWLRHSVIAILVLLTACSKDEEFITISPLKIDFVKEDGSLISPGDCISPNDKCSVQIQAVAKGKGGFKVTTVEYTVNGAMRSMVFMRGGTQKHPVNLSDGVNIAQLIENGYIATVNYIIQDDFELVE